MNSELTNATIIFLMRDPTNNSGRKILLAMKKKGFGKGKWNGVGGKVEKGEIIEEAAIREAKEEIRVDVKEVNKVGELNFSFQNMSEWNQIVHVFLSNIWDGDPQETDEMDPKWFDLDLIPYDKMWVDDSIWLPKVLEGDLVKGYFEFETTDKISKWKLY